jgi:hypothetical protein
MFRSQEEEKESPSPNPNAICQSMHWKSVMRADGVLGGKYEYSPYISTWMTHGNYRVERVYRYNEIEKVSYTTIPPHILKARKILKMASNSSVDGFLKMQAFQSMLSLNDKQQRQEKEKKETSHEAEDPIIDVPQNTSIYELEDEVPFDEFGDYNDMRADIQIRFKLMTHTDYSGIDQIDKTDSGYAIRQLQDGICSFELSEIFAKYVEQNGKYKSSGTCMLKALYVDPKVVGLYIQAQQAELKKAHKLTHLTEKQEEEIIDKAYMATYKAMVHFEVRIEGFNYENYRKSILSQPNLRETELHAMSPLSSMMLTSSSKENNKKSLIQFQSKSTNMKGFIQHKQGATITPSSVEFKPYFYNSAKSNINMVKSFDNLLEVYCDSFINTDKKTAQYQPLNKNVSNLQLPYAITEQGKGPASIYWTSQDPWTREYPNAKFREDALKRYGFNENSEKYFKMMFNSSLRRHGLNKKVFIKTIDEHYSLSNKSTSMNPLMIRCAQAVIDVGTLAGNMVYYTSDYRFVPIYDARTDSSTKNHVIRMGMDSFDSETVNGGQNSDDCEGGENVSSKVTHCYEFGRYDLTCDCGGGGANSKEKTKKKKKGSISIVKSAVNCGDWLSRTLQRVQLFLLNTVLGSIGGTVTSEYVDTDNKTVLNIKESDLPIINDKIDRNSRCGGHCWGYLMSLLTAKTMLANGKNESAILDKIKPFYITSVSKSTGEITVEEHDEFLKRELKMPGMNTEGTGSIEPTILPVNEVYKEYPVERSKATVEKLFLRVMKAKLLAIGGNVDMDVNNAKTKKRDAIMSKFQPEGVPFYIEEQLEDRRASLFYKHGVQIMFPSLYRRYDVTLNQAALCKPNTEGVLKYGVNTCDLLRANKSPNANGVALALPYKDLREKWCNEVIQPLEAVQNQMPLMAVGRYTPKQYQQDVYSYYIDPTTLALNDWHFPENFNEREQFDEKLSAMIDNHPDKTTILSQRKMNMERFHQVHLNDNETIVRLYSRTWKMNKSKEELIQFQEFVQDSLGLKHFGYFIEQHLANVDPVVEILCIIDINEFNSKKDLYITNNK